MYFPFLWPQAAKRPSPLATWARIAADSWGGSYVAKHLLHLHADAQVYALLYALLSGD